MNTFQPRTLRNAGLVCLVCLAAACSPRQGEFGDSFFPHGKWEQIPPSQENMVETVTLQHLVRFGSGQSAMTDDQRGQLDAFINANDLSNRDEIVVSAPGNDGLSAGRQAAIRKEIANYGLLAVDGGSPDGGLPGEVLVNVTRSVVIPPDCSVPQPEPTLRPNNKWGCTVESALGMMVADPNDLAHGRDLGPGDGEQASGALRRYRADEVKDLDEETTN